MLKKWSKETKKCKDKNKFQEKNVQWTNNSNKKTERKFIMSVFNRNNKNKEESKSKIVTKESSGLKETKKEYYNEEWIDTEIKNKEKKERPIGEWNKNLKSKHEPSSKIKEYSFVEILKEEYTDELIKEIKLTFTSINEYENEYPLVYKILSKINKDELKNWVYFKSIRQLICMITI